MTTHWLVTARGDPLGAVRRLITAVWRSAGLRGFLVPSAANGGVPPRMLTNPAQLSGVNPFQPVMDASIARFVPGFVKANPGARIGVLARPCETRALIEMTKLNGFAMGDLLTVTVDCLATLPADDYVRLVAWRSTGERLGEEALRFAQAGPISPYRFRSACQMCASPAADTADLNIGVLGVAARQNLLISSRDAATARRLHLDRLADGVAPAALTDRRARMLAQLAERRARTRERIEQGVVDRMPDTVEDAAVLLDRCQPCRTCEEVCPVTAFGPVRREPDGTLDRHDVARWMLSCVGCGMCEQACPLHLPLSAYFGHVHGRLEADTGYCAGRSEREPLPVLA